MKNAFEEGSQIVNEISLNLLEYLETARGKKELGRNLERLEILFLQLPEIEEILKLFELIYEGDKQFQSQRIQAIFQMVYKMDYKKYEDQPDIYQLFYQLYKEPKTVFVNEGVYNLGSNEAEILKMRWELEKYLQEIKVC